MRERNQRRAARGCSTTRTHPRSSRRSKMTDEHRLIAQTTDEFIDTEVLPNLDQLETKDWDLARRLIRRCGELGLLGTNVPEQYGGLDLDKVSSLIVAERIARSASFATTLRRPGQPVHACRSFSSAPTHRRRNTCRSWSPANWSAPTRSARRSQGLMRSRPRPAPSRAPDGSWTLNGEKMWITNGGFADVIIVFAKVDGEHFTAFIVEKALPRRERRQGRAQDGPPRLVDDVRSCCRTPRFRRATCSVRSARATRWRSTR